jgi:hypothetical protein
VIAEQYGLSRSTGDIDILETRGTDPGTLFRLAGKGIYLGGDLREEQHRESCWRDDDSRNGDERAGPGK